MTAAALIENAAQQRKRISADLGVAENLPDFFCKFIGGHQPVVNAFSEFLKRYWWRIDQKKAAAGWLSQDGTLYYTARLLDLREISEVLRDRYRFLLVDEYQDTDPWQHRVIEALRRPVATFRFGPSLWHRGR